MRWLLPVVLMTGCSSTVMELDRFNARAQKDCGSVFISRTTCPAGIAEMSDCMNAELQAGRAAKASWTMSTVEGDPIVSTLFTGGDTSMTLFVDTRADAFGSKEVQIRHCTATMITTDLVDGCGRLVFGECR